MSQSILFPVPSEAKTIAANLRVSIFNVQRSYIQTMENARALREALHADPKHMGGSKVTDEQLRTELGEDYDMIDGILTCMGHPPIQKPVTPEATAPTNGKAKKK